VLRNFGLSMTNNIFLKLLTSIVLVAVTTMPQETAAKKIEYLGHAYNGKVNKQGVPEGKGLMIINDLQVRGVFADRTVTDASVHYLVQQGKYTYWGENSNFTGTVIFDESDKITLKAGGKLNIKYYDPKPNYMDRISQAHMNYDLPKDRVVGTDFFIVPNHIVVTKETTSFAERDWSRVCSNYGIDKQLMTPPSTFTSYVEYNFSSYNNGKLEVQTREITNKAIGTDNSVWSYRKAQSPYDDLDDVLSVIYTNGDEISFRRDRSQKSDTITWKKTFKDGKVASAFSRSDGWDPTYKDNYVRYKNVKFSMNRQNIMKLWRSDNLDLNSSNIKGFNLENLPDNMTDKALKDHINHSVLPLLEDKGKNGNFTVFLNWKDYGECVNGVLTSYAAIKKAQEAAEQKAEQEKKNKEQQEMQKYYRKYGKKYVDAFVRGDILVGMPEGLLLMWAKKVKKYDGGNTRKYWLYDNNMWNAKHIYTVWVTNGKVSHVVIHN